MDDTPWQKFTTFFPRKTISGAWTFLSEGQVWRRRNHDGSWQYKQDAETEEDALNRQW